jgi:hypothetical protein
VLDRSTPDQVRVGTFTLHVLGPSPTKFTGSILVGFLEDPDPRRYKSDVSLTSNGKEIHQSVISRITAMPGNYTVRIQLQEERADLQQPQSHTFTIPVIVR